MIINEDDDRTRISMPDSIYQDHHNIIPTPLLLIKKKNTNTVMSKQVEHLIHTEQIS